MQKHCCPSYPWNTRNWLGQQYSKSISSGLAVSPLIQRVWRMLLALCRQLREVCIRASLSFKRWHACPGAHYACDLLNQHDPHTAQVQSCLWSGFFCHVNKTPTCKLPSATQITVQLKKAEESTALTCLNTELGIWSTKHISLDAIVWRWTLQITNEFTQTRLASEGTYHYED